MDRAGKLIFISIIRLHYLLTVSITEPHKQWQIGKVAPGHGTCVDLMSDHVCGGCGGLIILFR
jgi:hypothetical protein